MTPEQGYKLAKHQRPGVKIIMGPTEAREELTKERFPTSDTACSWFEYDCARLIGRDKLSLWETMMLSLLAKSRDTALPTLEDIELVASPTVSLKGIHNRIAATQTETSLSRLSPSHPEKVTANLRPTE